MTSGGEGGFSQGCQLTHFFDYLKKIDFPLVLASPERKERPPAK